jgi:hypothetical protein
MPKSTVLASGVVAPRGDRLSVELIAPDPPDLAPSIMIRWPSKPTLASPAAFDGTASDAMRILAHAVIALAAIKSRKRL